MSGSGVGELFTSNESLQDAPAVRLFAAKNLASYVTLMERHLDGSAKITEAELVSRIEQDLAEVGLPDQTGLGLIKWWASSGWLNRVSDGTGQAAQNVCSLTEDARSVLAFLRRQRRADSVATGGSMVSIASGLKRIASQLDGDPERIRIDLEEQIEALYRQLEDLAEGRRPQPNLVDLADEGRAIAYQMEQIITDIVRYGGMQNEITTALIEGPEDSDTAFRDRSRRLFTDYEALFDSRERASYTAFTRMVQDPDQRARLRSDITTVVESLPDLDASLREVMVQFFPRVAEQIGEVIRIEQRCALRIKRFFAAGTAEQARGLARQINEAIGVGHALLRQSVVDSPTRAELPIGRSALTSVGAIAFDIQDPSPPRPARQAEATADLSGFTGLASQVDIPQLTELVNTAVQAGPVSLPEMIGMVDAPYLGDVVVLWALAVRQDPDAAASAAASRVRFRSRDGVDREIEVPALMFRDRVASAGGL
ncbi:MULTISPECIES: DUF3375 family protein [Mycobacterium avium complex (MAC)]|uniref:DUF3375 family protein n=1 Tax=Mycobacterium avium complex (MAC) TaxID=120793 RepID=UPI0007A0C82F|nr:MULTISPECIES: DUF3375 family protein [Mycobacterium avium complex (MAC)]MCA2250818.1 DUF3375 domain-containing protein [Mycobacterium intracellulare]MDV3219409.1 DUF3375 domain-containing protein [Mycobacterium avium]